MSARELITEHLGLWTGAVTKKSSSGRGSNGKVELTGIKKLRELILELAVRGKLVEQNPTDEPANELLERVRAEKLHLVKHGEIKKRRKLPELSEMTTPFHLPASWEWAQLEDVGRDWGQKTPKDDFSYIDVASVDSLRGEVTQPSILSAEEAPSRARKIVSEGTLIYSTVRPYLQNIAVIESKIEPEPIASTAFAILHPLAGMPARFYLHYLRSPAFVRYVESVQTGIAYPAINDKQFFSGLVPVPPLEEQHRIVQKVDELMALCDRLEQQTSDQLEAHETLVDTLLSTLTQSENATELADNWARLAAHFDTLFTTEQSIDKLKQTILQLAVMGRLVEQDAGDEPAAEVVKRAHEKKAQLLSDKLIKKQKELPDITEPEKPFSIPPLWAFARLDDICTEVTSGSTPPKSEFSETSGIPYLKVYNIRSQRVDFDYKPQFVTENYHRTTLKRSQLLPGDVVMNIVGPPLGKTAIIPDDYPEWNCNQAIVRFRPIEIELNQFIHLYLKAGIFLKTIELIGTAGQDNISVTKSRSIVIPLPPKAEQHRIVQKVDELMALCDQLKERLNQSNETRCQLTEAVVDNALN